MNRLKRLGSGLSALLVAGVIWFPCLHLFFTRPAANFHAPAGLSPKARVLATRQLGVWRDPDLRRQELQRMRESNAEWDFMGRSFLAWSLANMALRDPPSKTAYLETIDRIIDETLSLEKSKGIYFFLMPYAQDGRYVVRPPRSLFLDGEIAMMLASRQLVAENAEYRPLLQERIKIIVDGLQSSPNHVLESYPNECWTFDHAVALAAIRMADHLDGTDHSGLCRDWIEMAKHKLVHKESGLLLSAFTTDYGPIYGPEGSSIWMVAHCLQIVDPIFARHQYDLARKQIACVTLGFGYAREWPDSWTGPADIDSGPIIPVFKVSAGSSGMAFIAASAFDDQSYLSSLAATLDFAGFPSHRNGGLKYCASNQVGDAALLYAATLGPVFDKCAATR
jgi:hypothetical protein